MQQFHIELEGVPGFLKSIQGPQVKRRWTGKSFKGFPFYESLGWMFYPSEDQTQKHGIHTPVGRASCTKLSYNLSP